MANHLFLFGHSEVALSLSVHEAFKHKNLAIAHEGTALTQLGGEPREVHVKNTLIN